MQELFRKFAVQISLFVGSIWALMIFITTLLLTGHWFNYSTEWENHVMFVISITTLLILFFLQRSQNHNDRATHLKLDELIKASENARNEVVSVEEQTEKDLEKLKAEILDDEIRESNSRY